MREAFKNIAGLIGRGALLFLVGGVPVTGLVLLIGFSRGAVFPNWLWTLILIVCGTVACLALGAEGGVLAAVAAGVATFVIYIFVYLIESALFLGVTREALQNTQAKLVISGCLLCGGILLSWIRRHFLQVYAIWEIAFGLVVNWRLLGELGEKLPEQSVSLEALLTRLAILGGGMYLIGRGMTNYAESKRNTTPHA